MSGCLSTSNHCVNLIRTPSPLKPSHAHVCTYAHIHLQGWAPPPSRALSLVRVGCVSPGRPASARRARDALEFCCEANCHGQGNTTPGCRGVKVVVVVGGKLASSLRCCAAPQCARISRQHTDGLSSLSAATGIPGDISVDSGSSRWSLGSRWPLLNTQIINGIPL